MSFFSFFSPVHCDAEAQPADTDSTAQAGQATDERPGNTNEKAAELEAKAEENVEDAPEEEEEPEDVSNHSRETPIVRRACRACSRCGLGGALLKEAGR